MASGRASSSFDFGTDDVLCSYDDYDSQDPSNGKRTDPSLKGCHEGRNGRPLVNVYGQQDQYPKEEIISAVEKCMKKYADNLMQFLEGISGRLSQLELYCYKLERSIGEFRADMIRDQGESDTKLKSLEKHLQEVHRSIQILRDKQELADTQKELTKLQVAPKESSTPTHSHKAEESVVQSSVSEPSTAANQHLALALPRQTAAPTSVPTRAPDQNQLPTQHQQPPSASLNMPQDRYVLNQSAPFYPQQSQPDVQYLQSRPQIQDSSQQAPQLPPHQSSLQQSFPQYQQQWPPQSAPQQFTQQAVAPTQQPTSQAQVIRTQNQPNYPPYPPQQTANPNPEAFQYTTIPPAGVNRSEVVPFGYGPPGSSVNLQRQPDHQGNQSSYGPPLGKGGAYVSAASYPPQSNAQSYSAMYNIEGGRGQSFQQGSYLPPSSQQVPPSTTMGLHHPGAQMMRAHPYGEIIEKAVSMGYPREQVAIVVNRMMESGQPVDFNSLLDRLNSRPASGGPRPWSG